MRLSGSLRGFISPSSLNGYRCQWVACFRIAAEWYIMDTYILSQAQTRVGRVVEAQPACSIDVDAADLIQDVLTVFQCHQYSALCCRMSRLVTCGGPRGRRDV